MSLFCIDTTKATVINGITYTAAVKKDVVINFSEAQYTVEFQENARDAEIKLIPDNIKFLQELTDIFPISEYDIKIKQTVYRYKHVKPNVSFNFEVCDKKSGEEIYFAEGPILSDGDYNYIRDILVKEIPQYEWRTVESNLKQRIESCMNDGDDTDL